MATHFSILTWKIPWTQEPGRHSPWSRKESDMTEPLTHTNSSPSTIPDTWLAFNEMVVEQLNTKAPFISLKLILHLEIGIMAC